MNGKKILGQGREELNALPIAERMERIKESRLSSLLKVGYITEVEAEKYREPLTELPTDTKDLVVAYFVRDLEASSERFMTLAETEKVKKIIGGFKLWKRGALNEGECIADFLTEEEQSQWKDELSEARITSELNTAKTFVTAKRNRIRDFLLRLTPSILAYSIITADEEAELDQIAYLRSILKENGYRERAKHLNKQDEEAIREASLYFLDLSELAYLNGIGYIREEEYKDKALKDKQENFVYRDEYDELMTEETLIYYLLLMLLKYSYNDGSLSDYFKSVKGALREGIKQILPIDELREKYNCFIEEAKIC